MSSQFEELMNAERDKINVHINNVFQAVIDGEEEPLA